MTAHPPTPAGVPIMDKVTKDRLLSLQADNDTHSAFMAMHSERFDKLRTRHEDGTAPRAVASFNLFQTPAPLARRMVALADIAPGDSVLEPSAGLGRILAPVMECSPARVVAGDISPDCCREIMEQFPGVRLIQGDFLDAATRERMGPPFDKIVMNPPFKMRADIKHIEAALTMLAPGGSLVGLCLSGFKRADFLATHGAHIETVPAGTFPDTKVETLLFKICSNSR